MGFWSKHDYAETTDSGIHIESIRQDVPEFERVYTAKLDNRASIKIVIKMFLNSLYETGELTQPNGRWVLFEPERIADKILDPTLVLLVQKYVDEVHRIDQAFRRSDPSEFIDKHGVKWRRV